MLECGANNKHIKQKVLEQSSQREYDFVTHFGKKNNSMKHRFQKALEKAYDWQNRLVLDYNEVHPKTKDKQEWARDKKYTYVGPHKWIVCLLGSDIYNTNNFDIENRKKIKTQKNMSISIMTMSKEPLQLHSTDYANLCARTSEGIYVNAVDKE